MNTRYVLSLVSLAIVVAGATAFVRHQTVERSRQQYINERVALISSAVGNMNQLKQVVTIQEQLREKKPLSDEQVAQLVTVVNGPPDTILQAKALTALSVAARTDELSASQKETITNPLIAALQNSNVLVRGSAASVLGNVGQPRAVSALLPLLNDPDEMVQRSAKNALKRLQKLPSST